MRIGPTVRPCGPGGFGGSARRCARLGEHVLPPSDILPRDPEPRFQPGRPGWNRRAGNDNYVI
ncbi:Hypothetical Protein RSKD131_4518 (plasmid) [Cereibacter sphaeroides KD131]|nr:Hypothetical Protein RSKD131_4518 [Cereibacter sphaeroides KD131]